MSTKISLILPKKRSAPSEDRTHDLQIALIFCDYETDALPTALPRRTEIDNELYVLSSNLSHLVCYLHYFKFEHHVKHSAYSERLDFNSFQRK